MASVSDWARVIGVTIVNHLREEELATFRKYKVFSMLEQSGNVVMNQSGRSMDWNIRYKNTPVTGSTGDTPRTFARHNLWKRAELPWRGWSTTDSVFRRELLENRGQQALVNVASQMAQRLQESLQEHLAHQVYADGNAPGAENSFHGLESFMGYSGTVSTANGAGVADQRTTSNETDRYGYPTDTYAGLSTQLGAYGGGRISGTASWPDVPVDPELDFYSPIVINYNSSGWKGTRNWQENCVMATREGIHACRRNDTKEAAIDMVVLDRKLFVQYLNSLETKERAIVTRENGLRAFGFSDVFEQDGVEITQEYACPPGRGYGLSIGNMEMRCLENTLFVAEGPFFDEELNSYRYACSTLGNLRFRSPRNFFTLAPVTSEVAVANAVNDGFVAT